AYSGTRLGQLVSPRAGGNRGGYHAPCRIPGEADAGARQNIDQWLPAGDPGRRWLDAALAALGRLGGQRVLRRWPACARDTRAPAPARGRHLAGTLPRRRGLAVGTGASWMASP